MAIFLLLCARLAGTSLRTRLRPGKLFAALTLRTARGDTGPPKGELVRALLTIAPGVCSLRPSAWS